MARAPKTISSSKAKEIADRYFDLDSSADRSPADDVEDEEDGAFAPPRRRRSAPAKLKAPPKPLNDRQLRFVEEYCVDFNGTQAAIRAGYSEKTAYSQAYDLLRKPEIERAVEKRMKHLEARAEWDSVKVLRRLAEELTADLADILDEDTGALKPVREWPLVWRRGLVAGIKTKDLFDADGDVVGIVHEIKLSDRIKRLELMGKHVAVQAWKEKKEVDVPKDSPLAELARQLNGTGLRPREIEGTARAVDGK